MIDVESSGPASADPIELEDPLPPKWSDERYLRDAPPVTGMLLSFPPGQPLSSETLAGLREILGEPQQADRPTSRHKWRDLMPPEATLEEIATSYHLLVKFDDRPDIKTTLDTDQAVQRAVQAECDHRVPTTSILGGEPLTVTRCMACGLIDWADLRKQADAYARRYGARLLEETYGHLEYPDGSRRIAYSEMVNIQQVHSLFTIEPGTNMCEEVPRVD